MTQIKSIFRLLIIIGFCFSVVGAGLDFLVPGIVPEPLQEAYDAYTTAEEPSLLWLLIVSLFGLGILIVGAAATIGLLLFKRWSRRLAFWLSVLSVLFYPVLGPVIYSGWAYMLIELSMMLWGAALAMAYFSELKVHFDSQC